MDNSQDTLCHGVFSEGEEQLVAGELRLEHLSNLLSCLGLQIGRLEGQVARYKNAAENAEKVEDELKAEKRKLQREVIHLISFSAPCFFSSWTALSFASKLCFL